MLVFLSIAAFWVSIGVLARSGVLSLRSRRLDARTTARAGLALLLVTILLMSVTSWRSYYPGEFSLSKLWAELVLWTMSPTALLPQKLWGLGIGLLSLFFVVSVGVGLYNALRPRNA